MPWEKSRGYFLMDSLLSFVDSVLHFMPHRHCTPVPGVYWSEAILTGLVGSAYIGWAIGMFRFSKRAEKAKYLKPLTPFFTWTGYVFVFCALSKWIELANIFVGWTYVLSLVNNVALLYSMLRLFEAGLMIMDDIATLKTVISPQEALSVAFGKTSTNLDLSPIAQLARRADFQHASLQIIDESYCMVDRDMRIRALTGGWVDKFQDYAKMPLVYGLDHYKAFDIPDHWKKAHRLILEGEEVFLESDNDHLEDLTFSWRLWPVYGTGGPNGMHNEIIGMMMHSPTIKNSSDA